VQISIRIITIKVYLGIKLFFNVLYVCEINQNLLTIGFTRIKDKMCLLIENKL